MFVSMFSFQGFPVLFKALRAVHQARSQSRVAFEVVFFAIVDLRVSFS